jgi:hypothetical protein
MLSKIIHYIVSSTGHNIKLAGLYLVIFYRIKVMAMVIVFNRLIFTDRHVFRDFLRTPVSSTNKAERHNITEILLKGVLNTITQTLT